MDFQWYNIQDTGGGSKTDMQTDTVTVTEDMSSASWKTDRIDSDSLAWQADAYKEADGIITPVEIGVRISVSKPSTAFEFAWVTRFNGFIRITTWKK